VHRNLLAQQITRQHPIHEMSSKIVIVKVFRTQGRNVQFANIHPEVSVSASTAAASCSRPSPFRTSAVAVAVASVLLIDLIFIVVIFVVVIRTSLES
jgi:hypothetical protein